MNQINRAIQCCLLLTFALAMSNISAKEEKIKSSDSNFTNDLKERRERVFEQMNENSILILFSAENKNRSNDVDWMYRQNNDLFYLTGSTHPESYLVLIKQGRKTYEYYFHKESSQEHVQWVGILPTSDQIKANSGISNVYPNAKFNSFVDSLLNGSQFFPDKRTREWIKPKHYDFFEKLTQGEATLLLSLGQSRSVFKQQASAEAKFASQVASQFPELKIQNISFQLTAMREIKTKYELAKMQKAIDITVEAQKKAMHRVQTAQREYQVQAIIDYTFRDQGACCPSFSSITASGSNTTILHYEHPNAKIEKDKLFLTDIGAEYDYYAADVTRTYPADGTFSQAQKDVYSAVLNAQKIGIKNMKRGSSHKIVESAIAKSLGEDLLALGLIDKKEKEQIYIYYAHSFGHSLGLDVHDLFRYYQTFKKNMVITVEPGLYVRKGKVLASPFYKALKGERKERVDKALEKYDGIGVRIEDDILVTRSGPKILSKEAPREIDEIEEWMAKLE